MFSVVIHYLQLYTRLLSAAIRVCIMQLILRTPFISNRHKKFSEELLFIPREDFQCTLFNWEFLKSILRSERCGFNKLAHLNCPAPICDMVSLDGKTPHRLYENNFQVRQHTTLHERLAAAHNLTSYTPKYVPILLDTMSNEAMFAYGAPRPPERLYVIQEGNVVYEGGLGPTDYKPNELREWLESYKRNRSITARN